MALRNNSEFLRTEQGQKKIRHLRPDLLHTFKITYSLKRYALYHFSTKNHSLNLLDKPSTD